MSILKHNLFTKLPAKLVCYCVVNRVFPFSDKDKCCHDFSSSSKGVPKDFVAGMFIVQLV